MGVMKFGGETGPVGYMSHKKDTDGNAIMNDVLYEYSFDYGLDGKHAATNYRALSPQETEYYMIKFADDVASLNEKYRTDAYIKLWELDRGL
jgi:hypothetical protein